MSTRYSETSGSPASRQPFFLSHRSRNSSARPVHREAPLKAPTSGQAAKPMLERAAGVLRRNPSLSQTQPGVNNAGDPVGQVRLRSTAAHARCRADFRSCLFVGHVSLLANSGRTASSGNCLSSSSRAPRTHLRASVSTLHLVQKCALPNCNYGQVLPSAKATAHTTLPSRPPVLRARLGGSLQGRIMIGCIPSILQRPPTF